MPADRASKPPSPWDGFLRELDGLLRGQVQVHCIGGFVVSMYYGLPRPTADIDYYALLPHQSIGDLQRWAGPDSTLAKKYKVHLQYVPMVSLPEDYAERLSAIYPGRYENLRLYAPDPYDLILSKLERNSPKDRDDVAFLAGSLHLSRALLRERLGECLVAALPVSRRLGRIHQEG